jgi:DNA topoisomerase IA
MFVRALQLYQQGLISYPRTETEKFPAEMDLRALISEQRTPNVFQKFKNSNLTQSSEALIHFVFEPVWSPSHVRLCPS